MFECRQLSQYSTELDSDTIFVFLSVLVEGRTPLDNPRGGFYIPKRPFDCLKSYYIS